jgi:hypothetical protein
VEKIETITHKHLLDSGIRKRIEKLVAEKYKENRDNGLFHPTEIKIEIEGKSYKVPLYGRIFMSPRRSLLVFPASTGTDLPKELHANLDKRIRDYILDNWEGDLLPVAPVFYSKVKGDSFDRIELRVGDLVENYHKYIREMDKEDAHRLSQKFGKIIGKVNKLGIALNDLQAGFWKEEDKNYIILRDLGGAGPIGRLEPKKGLEQFPTSNLLVNSAQLAGIMKRLTLIPGITHREVAEEALRAQMELWTPEIWRSFESWGTKATLWRELKEMGITSEKAEKEIKNAEDEKKLRENIRAEEGEEGLHKYLKEMFVKQILSQMCK